MDSLTNACHRSVLYSIIDNSKDANEIAGELNISLSAIAGFLIDLYRLVIYSFL